MGTRMAGTTVEVDRLLTFSEVKDLTGISKPTISRAVTSGELACVRFGKRAVRVPAGALVAFIEGGGVSLTVNNRSRKARNRDA